MFDNVRRVFGQLVVYGSGDVAILVVNVMLVPVYTRVLSPTDYGALALLLVLGAFLLPLTHLGFDEAFLRFYYESGPAERRQVTGTIVIFLIVSNVVLLMTFAAAAPWMSRQVLGSVDYVSAVVFLLLTRFVSAFLFIPLNLLRVQNKSRQFASWTLGRAAGTVAVRLFLVVGLRLGVLGIMLADFIVALVFLTSLTGVIRPVLAWSFSWTTAKSTLRYGLPRVPYALLHQTMGMSDRFFLRMFLPLSEVGVYSIGTTAATLVKFYSVSFARAWSPFAFDTMRRDDAPVLFGRMATYAFAMLIWVTLAVATLAGPIVTLLTPPAYHHAADIVPMLALGIALQSLAIFLSTSLNIVKQSRALPVTTLLAAIVTVGGHLLLIPDLGLRGAAFAVAGGQLVLSATMFVLGQRAYRIEYEGKRLAKLTLVGAGLYAFAGLAAPAGRALEILLGLLTIGSFPVLVLAVGFLHRKELVELRTLLRNAKPRRARAGTASDRDPTLL